VPRPTAMGCAQADLAPIAAPVLDALFD
jgi:hypothetical protein